MLPPLAAQRLTRRHPMTATPVPPTPAPPTVFDPAAPVAEEYDVFCHACGYSLLGLVGDRCPECGAPFDPNELPYARVPWLHRRRIGTFKAYWQTVMQVVLRPSAFAEELCRPVRISADDARRFRVRTVYLAATSAALVAVAVFGVTGEWARAWRRGPGEIAEIVIFVMTLWLASAFFLRLATDMPVFIWQGLPSRPPNELAPLHHYAAAPLALTPVVGLLSVIVPLLAWMMSGPPELFYMAAVAAAGVLVAWGALSWATPLVLMRRATGCGPGRVLALALYLPVHCLIMAVLVFASVMVGVLLFEGLT